MQLFEHRPCVSRNPRQNHQHGRNYLRHAPDHQRLTEAGLSEKTAETVTDVLRETREGDLSQLVTKEHLDQRLALLDQRIQNLEQRLIIKLGGMMVIAVGVMATLVKLL